MKKFLRFFGQDIKADLKEYHKEILVPTIFVAMIVTMSYVSHYFYPDIPFVAHLSFILWIFLFSIKQAIKSLRQRIAELESFKD